MTVLPMQTVEATASECRSCGACCSFSPEWPRFSLESYADLDRIPRAYVDDDRGRMQCSGNRCLALVGDVGISTACAIYAVRPDVCKACLPGDESCRMARRHFNLSPTVAHASVAEAEYASMSKMTAIDHKGYRIEVSPVGRGWRASIFSPDSTSPWPDSPVNLEKSSAEEIVAEAKRIIEIHLGPRIL